MGVCASCVLSGRFYILHSKDRRKRKKQIFSSVMKDYAGGGFLQKNEWLSLPHLSAQMFIGDSRAVSFWPPLSDTPAVIALPGERGAGARNSPGPCECVPSQEDDVTHSGWGPQERKIHTTINLTTPDFIKVWTLSLVWKSLIND